MKPPPFAYSAATTTAEALEMLAEAGDSGKVLAGGQSLIPLLNMRLAAPGHLVDINRVDELATVTVDDAGVRVGAIVRHAELEQHADARSACPLIGQALRLVAHPVIRNRGTTVGSIAHADPAGEMPAVLAVLGGSVRIARLDGEVTRRDVSAGEFFLAPLESALQPGELVESVAFPRLPAGAGSAFLEVARRHGDYALCGVGAVVEVADGVLASARAGYISMAGVPLVLDLTDALGRREPGALDIDAAAEHARASVEPEADIHASAAYRRHLAGVLTARAVRAALASQEGSR